MNEEQIKHHHQAAARQWAALLSQAWLAIGTQGAPRREAIRKALQPYTVKDNARAWRLWVGDWLLFVLGQWAVVAWPLPLKPLGGMMVALAMVRLFLLGHDAAHGALTRSPPLNAWLGRLAFLPSLIAYASWTCAHNGHHAYVNSIPGDIWRPLSPQEYRSLNAPRRGLYRLYRHRWGVGAYFLIEIWWKNFFFPSPRVMGADIAQRSRSDSLLATGFGIALITALYLFAEATHQATAPLLLLGGILPFLADHTILGFVSYLHHTYPKVGWRRSPAIGRTPHDLALESTVHLRFPEWIDASLHHIMKHPAHHLNPGIPCYHLQASQQKLEELLPDTIVVQDFSWRWYAECTRICKLYDFERRCWLGFNGEPSAGAANSQDY